MARKRKMYEGCDSPAILNLGLPPRALQKNPLYFLRTQLPLNRCPDPAPSSSSLKRRKLPPQDRPDFSLIANNPHSSSTPNDSSIVLQETSSGSFNSLDKSTMPIQVCSFPLTARYPIQPGSQDETQSQDLRRKLVNVENPYYNEGTGRLTWNWAKEGWRQPYGQIKQQTGFDFVWPQAIRYDLEQPEFMPDEQLLAVGFEHELPTFHGLPEPYKPMQPSQNQQPWPNTPLNSNMPIGIAYDGSSMMPSLFRAPQIPALPHQTNPLVQADTAQVYSFRVNKSQSIPVTSGQNVLHMPEKPPQNFTRVQEQSNVDPGDILFNHFFDLNNHFDVDAGIKAPFHELPQPGLHMPSERLSPASLATQSAIQSQPQARQSSAGFPIKFSGQTTEDVYGEMQQTSSINSESGLQFHHEVDFNEFKFGFGTHESVKDTPLITGSGTDCQQLSANSDLDTNFPNRASTEFAVASESEAVGWHHNIAMFTPDLSACTGSSPALTRTDTLLSNAASIDTFAATPIDAAEVVRPSIENNSGSEWDKLLGSGNASAWDVDDYHMFLSLRQFS